MVLHEVKNEQEDLREELLLARVPALMPMDYDESFIAATGGFFPGESFAFDYSDEDEDDDMEDDDFDDMEEEDFDDDEDEDDDEDDDEDEDFDDDEDDYDDYDDDFEYDED